MAFGILERGLGIHPKVSFAAFRLRSWVSFFFAVDVLCLFFCILSMLYVLFINVSMHKVSYDLLGELPALLDITTPVSSHNC